MDNEKLTTWLATYLAHELKLSPEQLDLDKPFTHFGLDSVALVGMVGDIEDFLGCEIDPKMAYDFPTVRSFAKALTEKKGETR